MYQVNRFCMKTKLLNDNNHKADSVLQRYDYPLITAVRYQMPLLYSECTKFLRGVSVNGVTEVQVRSTKFAFYRCSKIK